MRSHNLLVLLLVKAHLLGRLLAKSGLSLLVHDLLDPSLLRRGSLGFLDQLELLLVLLTLIVHNNLQRAGPFG